jgi:Protein of unknown function (DUF3124)
VPIYSSVALHGRVRADFSVTLSIHNMSDTHPLVLKRVGFFDTAGAIVEEYLREPIALKPFATVEIFVPVNDIRGGTGANFVVNWSATDSIAEPAAAALMLGGVGGANYSFISQGHPIRPSKPQARP